METKNKILISVIGLLVILGLSYYLLSGTTTKAGNAAALPKLRSIEGGGPATIDWMMQCTSGARESVQCGDSCSSSGVACTSGGRIAIDLDAHPDCKSCKINADT